MASGYWKRQRSQIAGRIAQEHADILSVPVRSVSKRTPDWYNIRVTKRDGSSIEQSFPVKRVR